MLAYITTMINKLKREKQKHTAIQMEDENERGKLKKQKGFQEREMSSKQRTV